MITFTAIAWDETNPPATMCYNLANFENFLALLAFGISGMSVLVQEVAIASAIAVPAGARRHSSILLDRGDLPETRSGCRIIPILSRLSPFSRDCIS